MCGGWPVTRRKARGSACVKGDVGVIAHPSPRNLLAYWQCLLCPYLRETNEDLTTQRLRQRAWDIDFLHCLYFALPTWVCISYCALEICGTDVLGVLEVQNIRILRRRLCIQSDLFITDPFITETLLYRTLFKPIPPRYGQT